MSANEINKLVELNPTAEFVAVHQSEIIAVPKMTVAKFRLPDFDANNAELWFATTDVIFADNNVNAEKKKFAILLQYLDAQRLANIQSIIVHPEEEEPYTRAKAIIINLYGITEEQKLDRLLTNVKSTKQTRPSLILEEIRNLSSGMAGADKLIKRAWLQKLSPNLREILIGSRIEEQDELAKLADKVYAVKNDAEKTPPSETVCAVQSSSQNADLLTNLCTAITTLTNEVAAMKTQWAGRPRSRSRDAYRSEENRNRERRQRSKSRDWEPDLIGGTCWYHRTFSNKATKCKDGCNRLPHLLRRKLLPLSN
jgi:hypothetical protein